jgi:hypothetical protein
VIVDELDGILEIGAAHDRQHRPEDLFLVNPHLGFDFVEHGAADEKPVFIAPAA